MAEVVKNFDLDRMRREATAAVLKRLTEAAEGETADNVRALAEAWAWMHSPGQPHRESAS